MEGNVLLPELEPPHSQTRLLVVGGTSKPQLPPVTTSKRQKELTNNDDSILNNEPTLDSHLHHLKQVIGQIELMGSLYNQARSYLTMDSSSLQDKTPLLATHAELPPQQQQLQQHQPTTPTSINSNQNIKNNKEPTALPHTAAPLTKMKACRAPLSRKFAHPCICDSKNHHKNTAHHNNHINNNSSTNSHQQPPPFPLYLYDPLSRKCLPTSRQRDMLLRDCLAQQITPVHPHQQDNLDQSLKKQQLQHPCIYDDLRCDPRRLKCVCKPSLHLYYETNWSSFGCQPVNFTSPPEGITCRKDQIYNVISKECQKIFDINDLPPSYMSGLSANQFPFVTLALIWVLLLIVILTAKLRKIRTTTTHQHRHSSSMSMRNNRAGLSNQRQYSYYGPPTLVHSIMAAFHGHQHLNQDALRGSLDPTLRNYNDTDFFLNSASRQHRYSRDMFLGDGDLTESQQSLNNPPPKFEDIYPSCPLEPPPPPPSSPGPPRAIMARPLSNDNLPSYHEAMKLQNSKPPDGKA